MRFIAYALIFLSALAGLWAYATTAHVVDSLIFFWSMVALMILILQDK